MADKNLQMKERNNSNTEWDLLYPYPAKANSKQIGGVMPVDKTTAMTQDVGVDSSGRLFTAPGGGSGSGKPYDNIYYTSGWEDHNRPTLVFEKDGGVTAIEFPLATQTIHGFMSISDKIKLDGLTTGGGSSQILFEGGITPSALAETYCGQYMYGWATPPISLTPFTYGKRLRITAVSYGDSNYVDTYALAGNIHVKFANGTIYPLAIPSNSNEFITFGSWEIIRRGIQGDEAWITISAIEARGSSPTSVTAPVANNTTCRTVYNSSTGQLPSGNVQFFVGRLQWQSGEMYIKVEII